jgi:hypothetical protein
MVWPGSETAPPRWETVAQPTNVVLYDLFTLLIYIDSESSRYSCIQKLLVWKIYSFCEEMLYHIWSRVSRISDTLIKSLNRFFIETEWKKYQKTLLCKECFTSKLVLDEMSLWYKILFICHLNQSSVPNHLLSQPLKLSISDIQYKRILK